MRGAASTDSGCRARAPEGAAASSGLRRHADRRKAPTTPSRSRRPPRKAAETGCRAARRGHGPQARRQGRRSSATSAEGARRPGEAASPPPKPLPTLEARRPVRPDAAGPRRRQGRGRAASTPATPPTTRGAARGQVRQLAPRPRSCMHSIPIDHVGDYDALTTGVQILQRRPSWSSGPDFKASTIVGYTDVDAIDQACSTPATSPRSTKYARPRLGARGRRALRGAPAPPASAAATRPRARHAGAAGGAACGDLVRIASRVERRRRSPTPASTRRAAARTIAAGSAAVALVARRAAAGGRARRQPPTSPPSSAA